MRPIDLARSLDADLDDVLVTLLDLSGTRHIRSEFTRIGSVSILNEFAKKTGIKVKVRAGKSDQLANRVSMEGKKTEADVIFLQESGYLEVLGRKDFLAPLTEAPEGAQGSA